MFVVTIMFLTIFGSRYPRCCSVIVAPILFSTCRGRKRFHSIAVPPYQNWNTPSSRIPWILVFTNKSICSFNTNNIFSFSSMAGLCRFFGYDDGSSNTMMVTMFGWRGCSTIRHLGDGWRFDIRTDGWRCSGSHMTDNNSNWVDNILWKRIRIMFLSRGGESQVTSPTPPSCFTWHPVMKKRWEQRWLILFVRPLHDLCQQG